MAKPTDMLIEDADTDTFIVGEISAPNMPSLGWQPVDHLYIHIEDQDAVGELISSGADPGEDSLAIEFTVADLPANALLADIENQDLGLFDLNDLLGQADAAPEGHMTLVSDGSDMESDVAETALQMDSPPSAVDHLPINMAFPQLTIVIDDESGPDIVAI